MKDQKGQIIIIAAVFVLVVTILVAGLVSYAGVQIKSHRQAVGRVQGLNIAEAAVEKAIWRLNNEANYTGEAGTAYGNGVYNVTITNVGNNKLVKAEAFIPNAVNPKAKRTVQVTLTTGTTNLSFNYATQIGDGGLEMEAKSKVIGDVYSDGKVKGHDKHGPDATTIEGDVYSANANGSIEDVKMTGDAFSHKIKKSDVSGNANGFTLEDTEVSGNVSADNIKNCTITGNATYNTRTSCTVSGTSTTPNNNVPIDPPTIPLPITEEQITAWQDEAAAGGVIGNQTITGNVPLGPKKIDGDLRVKKDGVLTLTGTVWVTGDITVENDGLVKLDASYGSFSGVLLAAVKKDHDKGQIQLDDKSEVQGSGQAGSYILILSQNEEPKTAIKVSHDATAAILSAPYGTVELKNKASLKEVIAYKLKLKNSAEIKFEAGLLNVQVPSGGALGWEMLDGSWQLLQ